MDHKNILDKFLSNSRLRGDQTKQTKAPYDMTLSTNSILNCTDEWLAVTLQSLENSFRKRTRLINIDDLCLK